MQRKLRLQDYTVGWICALADELAAAAELMDEEHQRHPNDLHGINHYTLGCMEGHNVVIVCLPAGQPGTSPAATVASHMRLTFTSVRFCLLVGIGGGVPSDEFDIRLGDVVVSKPYREHGGVIQYDLGKTEPGGFVRTGTLNTPPPFLLSAMNTLQADHYRDKSSLLPYISMIGRQPRFTLKDAEPDVLFKATYNHVKGNTCDQCDKTQVIQRKKRESNEVVVYYGTIASGNQVVKDGNTRDQLSSKLGGILCFEMEAAGLMNYFPCLVIRGICDYADSHKNKSWQPYAAAVAAAYAKALLSIIPASEIVEQHTVNDAMNRGTDSIHLGQAKLKSILADLALEKNAKLNWQESIVDLLKLLGLPSDPNARDQLADKLHVRVGATRTLEQNTALHRAIMKELAANNGNLPRKISKCYACGEIGHWARECPKC